MVIKSYEDLLIEEKKELLSKNFKELDQDLENKDKRILEKIQNHLIRVGLSHISVDDFLNKAKSSIHLKSFLIKDPGKQNLHENTAFKFLKQFNYSEVILLPKNQANKSLYLDELGDISTNKSNVRSKSLDFKITMNGKAFYISHKYTNESGGAQDNQYNDLKSFVLLANKNISENKYFIAVGDGNYYSKSKQDEIKDLCLGNKTFYSKIDDLYQLIQNIVNS